MKKTLLLLFLFHFVCAFSQKKEMVELFFKGNYDQAIAMGKQILQSEPNDFDVLFLMASAEDKKGNFTHAIPYLDSAKKLITKDWQKSWTLLEFAKNSYGTGKIEDATLYYNEALAIKGTKNSEKELKQFGMLTGLDEFYTHWKTQETKNIIFHFEPSVNQDEMERIAQTRQIAFEEINVFFNSSLPKKVDFFVWNTKEVYNPTLKENLGFSDPVFCISHNRLNQSPGHEIAHHISFWKNNNNTRTKFINEGIGVCFDQLKNDQLKIAQKSYKTNAVNIKEIWKNQTPLSDDILYPISGAFVHFLIEYNKEKFMLLIDNQTYENALEIYGKDIDNLITDFTEKLNK